MEMGGRRMNYSLLSQFPEDQGDIGGFHESNSGDKSIINKAKSDWDGVGDYRVTQQQSNRGNSLFGLQRQSSGSSFGESSLSGEYYAPTNDLDVVADMYKVGELRTKGIEGPSSSKSWAQQTEESYQLQLALALRLSSEATSADDPNFLDPMPDNSVSGSSIGLAETLSHRFWVNGCLSYFDKIPDGFYIIHGMNSYVWTVCIDLQEDGHMPTIESLKSIESCFESSMEVVLIDRRSDPSLKELQNRAHNISSTCITTKDVVDQLAKLVCSRMGGAASTGENDMLSMWKDCSDDLKDCFRSVVVPIGSLSFGLCKHRAILFKVLADTIELPCRIAKGCRYCGQDDASSCLVRFGLDREYLVDLVGKPGCLCDPDSSLNGLSSITISSPLRFPRAGPAEHPIDFKSLAKQYFSDCLTLSLEFDDSSTGTPDNEGNAKDLIHPKQFDSKDMDLRNLVTSSNKRGESSQFSISLRDAQSNVKEINFRGHMAPIGRPNIQQLLSVSDRSLKPGSDMRFVEGGQLVASIPTSELSLEVDDLDIPWSDLVLKERIGAGSFGTVHRADWHGSDVAVKILMEQDFLAERFRDFLREVSIMKRLRHPNIVLFMGAVTQPPNLSIVTEYLSRGSLYRLLHKPGAREMLDERRRLNMAYDVAKGMNYLHRRNPPIVHRDLKSPNLLVDKKYTVKVCDFGLSRLKANTFLSSKSAAGTPEWMAPEVLRDEPSNEKSDVYSFGVILWELTTLQQPWSNLNPAQVVAAVGFRGKRLEVPCSLNPQIASIIEACWHNETWKRPSFSSIMESLRPLIKSPIPQPGHADMPLIT